jgi:hypothetical protein
MVVLHRPQTAQDSRRTSEVGRSKEVLVRTSTTVSLRSNIVRGDSSFSRSRSARSDATASSSAIAHVRDRASFATKIEAEVADPVDAPRAARAGADIVLLDNMDPETTGRGVERLAEAADDLGREILAEASGGIGIEDVPEYAATGVDVVSLGRLTHSAPALDFSFRTG